MSALFPNPRSYGSTVVFKHSIDALVSVLPQRAKLKNTSSGDKLIAKEMVQSRETLAASQAASCYFKESMYMDDTSYLDFWDMVSAAVSQNVPFESEALPIVLDRLKTIQKAVCMEFGHFQAVAKDDPQFG